MNIRAGQRVYIRPEWQDEGDGDLNWMALDNATDDDLRVRIVPTNTGLNFPPVCVVKLEWLED